MSLRPKRIEFHSRWKSLDDCRQFAVQLSSLVREPMCIALVGTLGAGKTQFVRFFVEAMQGDSQQVSSPTFVLVNPYHARVPIAHLDLYRLEKPAELDSFGFDDWVYGESICLIEWANKFSQQMPESTLWLEIQTAGEVREVTIAAVDGSEHAWIISELQGLVGDDH